MKTQQEKELLETIRKWEDLCHESLTDAAYWKGQAKESLAALRVFIAAREGHGTDVYTMDEAEHKARAAISKAEGRE